MKILVTNDDGIYGEGLRYLVNFAKELGDVIVVAPKTEQSAKSHALNIKDPFTCEKVDVGFGVDTYVVDSTPADCVRYAHYGLRVDIDLVLSGVNKGYNLGEDIMYSGTVAAATEAATLNINSLAISSSRVNFNGLSDNLIKVYNYITDNNLFDIWNLYNINIPIHHKDIRITRMGERYYVDQFLPQGNDMYLPTYKEIPLDMDDNSIDTNATMSGYISVTPLTLNRTNMTVFEELNKL